MITDATTIMITENNTHDVPQNNPKSQAVSKETAAERLLRLKHEYALEKERAKQETLLAKAEAQKQAVKARKAKREEEKALKIRKAQLEQFVVDALNETFCVLPQPPSITPKLWADAKGEKFCILVDKATNSCKSAVMSVVKDEITRLTYQIGSEEPWTDYGTWTDAQIESCFRRWRHFTHPCPKPKAWGFKSDPALVFYRHSFDPDINCPTPTADELFSRMEDPDTVKAWVGGLIVSGSYRQQYLVIEGDGGDGKGSFARFLNFILRDEYYGAQEPPKNQFFGTMFADRALVCFQDLRDPNFYQSSILLGSTGGDTLQLERKGVDMTNEQLRCRVMMLINPKYKPKIYRTAHDLRRILWTKIRPLPQGVLLKDSDTYDALLIQEAPGIIAQCLEAYYRRCPFPQPLVQPAEIREQIYEFALDPRFDDNAKDFETVAADYFVLISDDGKPRPFVTVQTVNDILLKEFRQSKTRTAFKNWLTAKGCKQAKNKDAVRVWFGLSLLSNS